MVKHIVQFSGGAASAYVAYLVAQEFGKENTILLNHDTKAESPDTKRFMRQVSEFIDVPVTEVSDGRDLWEVIEDNGIFPNSFIPFCTRILKLEPKEKFLKTLKEDFVLYNGLGFEEWRRVQRAVSRSESKGWAERSLLFERGISSEKVKQIIRVEWGICLPETYRYLEHNNCIPCFKAGKGHFYKVWKYYPEQFSIAKEYEENIGHTVFKDISLSELEQKWIKGLGQEDLFDDMAGVPCMCAG